MLARLLLALFLPCESKDDIDWGPHFAIEFVFLCLTALDIQKNAKWGLGAFAIRPAKSVRRRETDSDEQGRQVPRGRWQGLGGLALSPSYEKRAEARGDTS